MHIGIDALFRLPEAGGRTHLQQLLHAWRDSEDRISLFTTAEGAKQLRAFAGPNVTFHVYDLPGRHFALRVIWEQLFFPRLLQRAGLDALLCAGNLIPLTTDVPTALMLRNPLPFCPNVRPPAFSRRQYFRYQLVGRMMLLSAARASKIIFVSRAFQDVILKHVELAPARCAVVYHGAEPPAEAQPAPYAFPYLVCISAVWPYKNMRELVLGYAQVHDQVPDWRLVFVGPRSHPGYYQQLRALVEQLSLSDRVIFAGGVEHRMIYGFLQGALAAIQTSTCESFGIPLLEAMCAGVPLACADTPVARELAGGAALWFDPLDPAAVATQLLRLIDPAERAALTERGRERAAQLPTWGQVAAQTRDILSQIANIPNAK